MNPKMLTTNASNFLNVSLVAIHNKLKSKDLIFQKTSHRSYFGHKTAKEIFKLKISPQIISMQILKGGTGKTTLTQSIGVRCSLYGLKVLFIDLDHQANLTVSCNIETNHKYPIFLDVIKNSIEIEKSIVNIVDGLDIIPSNIKNSILDKTLMINGDPLDNVYYEKLKPLKEKYDIILIDCPPSIGHSVASSILSSDIVINPVNPDQFSMEALNFNYKEMNSLLKKYKKNVKKKILFNKFHGRTNLSYEYLKKLIKHDTYGGDLFDTFIKSSQDFPNSINKGLSIFDAVRKSSAQEDIDLLCRELFENISIPTMETDKNAFNR